MTVSGSSSTKSIVVDPHFISNTIVLMFKLCFKFLHIRIMIGMEIIVVPTMFLPTCFIYDRIILDNEKYESSIYGGIYH
jgi:hypothetical protein